MDQMIPGRVHGHVIPAMKRLSLLILLLLVVPLAFYGGIYFSQKRGFDRAAYLESSQAEEVRKLRQTIYGSNYFHSAAHLPKQAARLAGFDPRSQDCFLRLSYLGAKRRSLELRGDGTLHSTIDGRVSLVTTLGEKETKDVFLRVVSSGLLNYSESTVQLKRALAAVKVIDGRNDTQFVISVPQLDANKVIEIHELDAEVRNVPDIIEYRLMLDFEKAMTELVPAEVRF
jgi:hypothetical protein